MLRSNEFTVFILALSCIFVESDIIPSPAVCATYPNEEFAIDLTRCQNTCEYYGRTWDCPINYKPNGDCYCKPGFARLKEDGKCVSVTTHAKCVSRLPIQPESCNKPNEIYTETVYVGVCDISCRTHGCLSTSVYTYSAQPVTEVRWGPHCTCGRNDAETYSYSSLKYKRLSNGQCVALSDPQCEAEFQPSPARCAALGQIYIVNAPCQALCYGGQYCPPPGPTCICPPNKIGKRHQTFYQPYSGNYYHIDMLTCYNPTACPPATAGGGGND
ncbi:uncharacterized protein LOC119079532 [Bradysia coprophila]|uniref:uncharacterized protein LOC119079532 n=1 Tax=Bradysia coprophila TaxID=38358 RepID=UPI00187DA4A0|nr:uncharacterized protein LOC119079532 [Bradysia coprophila]